MREFTILIPHVGGVREGQSVYVVFNRFSLSFSSHGLSPHRLSPHGLDAACRSTAELGGGRLNWKTLEDVEEDVGRRM